MDGLDGLVSAIKYYVKQASAAPSVWKADVDSAYRRVPIQPQDRWAAWVTFLVNGEAVAARHNAFMFGGISSIHSWDRLGAFLHVGRVALAMPVCRYVDDFFSIEAEATAEHALRCFARVVRAMLGHGALLDNKRDHGTSLEILGIMVGVTQQEARPELTDKKRAAWTGMLQVAKKRGIMMLGEASKFAGRLNFAARKCFRRLGRAMIPHFYAQQYEPLAHGRVGDMLGLAVGWWLQVLQHRVVQSVPMHVSERTAQLFCDARGEPARMAGVLFVEGEIFYTSSAPSEKLRATLQERRGKLIQDGSCWQSHWASPRSGRS